MKSIMALSSLFTSVSVLFIGVGLFIFFSNIELANAGVSSEKIGLINAGFYFGALLSGIAAQRWVAKVGHIRAFALFTALVVISILMHVLVKNEYALVGFRVILGFADYSLLMVVESWLNARSTNKNRSSILAVYTMVFYMAFMVASLVIAYPIGAASMYVLCAILAVGAIIPIMLTRTEQPELPHKMGISFPKLWEVVPLALLGTVVAGFLVGGFITMAPVYVSLRGLDNQVASYFILAAMTAGLMIQIPMGKFSYRFGRRAGLILASSFAIVAAALMWTLGQYEYVLIGSAFLMGCGVFTMYSLSSARANDSIPAHSNVVEVGRSLLFSYCIGSFLSPLLLGFLMKYMGAEGFVLQYLVLAGILLVFALTQAVIPLAKRGRYVSMPVNAGMGSVLVAQELEDVQAQQAQESADAASAGESETIVTASSPVSQETQKDNTVLQDASIVSDESLKAEAIIIEDTKPMMMEEGVDKSENADKNSLTTL
ncbi:MFS transporter [Vitreoscilla sp. C1]|uniref:MFS transporter n=1 Tax=Vitreoscilla sp. (strain C1) TaxID=96942 RepID=UPI00148EE75C|nr:MFS transporter [Vitreoscilla sp. C1]